MIVSKVVQKVVQKGETISSAQNYLQCRIRIDECMRIDINGTVFEKSLTALFNPLKAGFLRTDLGNVLIIFCILLAASSKSSGFRPAQIN